MTTGSAQDRSPGGRREAAAIERPSAPHRAVPPSGFNRALRAFLEQEISAPSTAIAGFLDILIEDARGGACEPMIPDLLRMQSANLQLSKQIAAACALDWSASRTAEERSAFESGLRHDLRTPLNAIKGYGEMLLEDLSGVADPSVIVDLNQILSCTDQTLRRIDRLAEVWSASAPAPSEGTLFATVADVLREASPVHPSAAAQRRLVGRILVVDDEASNRDLLSRRLARDGHRVEVAEHGAQALLMTAQAEFDLILLDIMMPGMSGFEVLRTLKFSEATRHIPVVVISALDQIDTIVNCIEAGAEDYLPKTFNPTLLRARITACLEKKALRDRETGFINELRIEKQISESLLLSILPQSIVTRIRQGERAIADHFDDVTMLFCDLVGFTPLAARMTPIATVDLLGAVFSTFDRSVAKWGVEKIKTMGDAYMVAGGIPERKPDHASRVAHLGLDMLSDVRDIGRRYGCALAARIGIHTGEAVAGVIGTNRFVYDVWGDTVNTAARMESHGGVDRVHVSAATRKALGPGFRYEPRGTIDIKGKGAMETYFLLGPAT